MIDRRLPKGAQKAQRKPQTAVPASSTGRPGPFGDLPRAANRRIFGVQQPGSGESRLGRASLERPVFSSKSREHHWWPVGLQKYWMDRDGDVSWIDPDGTIEKKRVRNRKVAYKSHGHTMLRGGRWETNFEDEFCTTDDKASKVVETLLGLKPLGRTPAEFLGLLVKRPRHLRDICKFYYLDEDIHRSLLLLLLSLLIRSPAKRFGYENYPARFGLPPSDDVGKANMRQQFRFAKKLCEAGFLSNQYFVLIHSPRNKFVFGDGSLDWLTGSLNGLSISGRTLVTLTPHLCVYFCTPHVMRPTPNCASLSAAPWMVDWINDIVQIYARDRLFFLGRPPVLTAVFRQRRFQEHARKRDPFIDMLDEVAGNRSVSSIFGRGTFQEASRRREGCLRAG